MKTTKTRALLVSSFIGVGILVLAMLLVSGMTVRGASVEPTPIGQSADNLCPEGTTQLRAEGLNPGQTSISDSNVTISYTIYAAPDGDPKSALDWELETADYTILLVGVMNGVAGGHLYDYRPGGSTADTFLTATDEPYRDISHVDFCYVYDPVSTPTNTPVSPTPTNTPVSPTPTNTPVSPTPTNTPVSPTPTNTPVSPTPTNTPVSPTPTNTPVSPTPTSTPTDVPVGGVVTAVNPVELLAPWLGMAALLIIGAAAVAFVWRPSTRK